MNFDNNSMTGSSVDQNQLPHDPPCPGERRRWISLFSLSFERLDELKRKYTCSAYAEYMRFNRIIVKLEPHDFDNHNEDEVEGFSMVLPEQVIHRQFLLKNVYDKLSPDDKKDIWSFHLRIEEDEEMKRVAKENQDMKVMREIVQLDSDGEEEEEVEVPTAVPLVVPGFTHYSAGAALVDQHEMMGEKELENNMEENPAQLAAVDDGELYTNRRQDSGIGTDEYNVKPEASDDNAEIQAGNTSTNLKKTSETERGSLFSLPARDASRVLFLGGSSSSALLPENNRITEPHFQSEMQMHKTGVAPNTVAQPATAYKTIKTHGFVDQIVEHQQEIATEHSNVASTTDGNEPYHHRAPFVEQAMKTPKRLSDVLDDSPSAKKIRDSRDQGSDNRIIGANIGCSDELTTLADIMAKHLEPPCVHLRLTNAAGCFGFANSVVQCFRALGAFGWLTETNRNGGTVRRLSKTARALENLLRPPYDIVRSVDGHFAVNSEHSDPALFYQELLGQLPKMTVLPKFSIECRTKLQCRCRPVTNKFEKSGLLVLRAVEIEADLVDMDLDQLAPAGIEENVGFCPNCHQDRLQRWTNYVVPKKCTMLTIQTPMFVNGKKVPRRIVHNELMNIQGCPWIIGACVEHIGSSLDGGRCRAWIKECDKWNVYEDESMLIDQELPAHLENMYLLFFIKQ